MSMFRDVKCHASPQSCSVIVLCCWLVCDSVLKDFFDAVLSGLKNADRCFMLLLLISFCPAEYMHTYIKIRKGFGYLCFL